mgnify:CR=1 FL=1|jgi:hypothetical protein
MNMPDIPMPTKNQKIAAAMAAAVFVVMIAAFLLYGAS